MEALERAGTLGQVREVGEALLAEEALIEGVVEVLDRAVAPRLPGRDEHRCGALVKAHTHDLAQPGRGDERAAVVRLDPARHAVARPQRVQRAEHPLIAAVFDDLDPGVVGGEIDLV